MFVVNELFALDAAGAYTDDVRVSYISNGAAPKLRVTVDSAFLTDESREYPIVVDPSVMVTGAKQHSGLVRAPGFAVHELQI